MRIELTDNNMGKTPAAHYGRKSISALFSIADKPISRLCEENENLLISPYSLGDMGDDIGSSSIFSIQNTEDSEKVVISTGNLMGFIGVSDIQIKIKSRFDSRKEDFFLHYMLQKVMRFNLFDMHHENAQEEVFDFLMFMFPYFLRNALRQGLYREYQQFSNNDAAIRGAIDVAAFIRKDTPFAGNVAYTVREYSPDNNMTELIRHTIEYIASKRFGQAVLNKDNEVIDDVNSIMMVTQSYDRAKRSLVIRQNLRHKVHPYYINYMPLRSLCLQILRMEEVKYGENEDEISGILFDGAWLWEEYVNTILCKANFIHPENKLNKGGIYLFEGKSGIRYPDFYKEDIVLDAKYKRMGSYDTVSKVDRDDIHQIIAYMSALKATKGGFISPLGSQQAIVPTSRLKHPKGSTISIFGIEVSKAETYTDFIKSMEATENLFLNKINSQFNLWQEQ